LRIENEELKIKIIKLFISFFLFFLVGCGYKPSIEYQNKIVGNRIKVSNDIDIKNPRESIFLNDAINDAIYTILDKNVCDKNYNTELKIVSKRYYLKTLDYDENGFPILYRAYVSLNVLLIDKNNISHKYSVNGIYDFRISSDSIIDDEIKLNAYKQASINALNKLFALIAKDGVKQ